MGKTMMSCHSCVFDWRGSLQLWTVNNAVYTAVDTKHDALHSMRTVLSRHRFE